MKTLPCPAAHAAIVHPDQIGFYSARETLTFREFDGLVSSAAQRLLASGISDGSRIGLAAANSIEYLTIILAAARIGASVVPINIHLKPADWISILHRAGCSLALCDQERFDALSLSEIPVYILGYREKPHGFEGCEKVLTKPFQTIDVDRESTLIFTSGSSGEPKGVKLSHGNHHYNALGSNRNIPLQPGDCWLLSLPLYHVSGLSILYRSLLSGSSVWVAEKFSEEEVNHLIDERKVTHLSLVPTMLQRLVESRGKGTMPKFLRAILIGGSSVPEQLLEKIISLSLPVITTYGLTEAASQVTALSFDDPREQTRTSGRVLPYRRLQIVDPSGNELPAGTTGEIAVSGEVLFKGYLGEKSKRVDTNRWFYTGDIGYLDHQGHLTVQGRNDDMIISGGENIFPAEIIHVAETYSGVNAAAVVATEDREWGHRPVLFVEAIDPDRFSVESLRSVLRERLAPYKVPKRIHVLGSMPRTAIGKIDRRALKQMM